MIVGLAIIATALVSFWLGANLVKPSQTEPLPASALPTPVESPVGGKTFLVTRVIDGDTIEIEDGQKVRYIGIDTPESVDPRKPVQCFGREASERNKILALNQRVHLEKDVSETDRYGRLLRYVYLDDQFINLELVRQGYAHAATFPPDVKHQTDFAAAERTARAENLGLWQACPAGTDSAAAASPASPVGGDGACLVKGNINTAGEKIYHLPGCGSYYKTKIDESRGERWFCGESDALAAGWRQALNCP